LLPARPAPRPGRACPVRLAGLDDDVLELRRAREPSHGPDRVLKVIAPGRRRLTEATGRDLHVLLADGAYHVGGGQVARDNPLGVEPDAHAVVARPEDTDITHTRKTGEGVSHL
jgi:hypothetical protein